jgi:ethanolamine utilization protein EutA (predicted chaperonin)
MYTIKLDVNDTIYDKVMFFLKNIPVTNIEVKKSDENSSTQKDDIVSFFHNSPLTDNIELTREKEIYEDKVSV